MHSSVVYYNRLVETPLNRGTNRYDYGTKKGWVNLTPQEILYKVYDSGTATQCISKLDKFTQADGFVDEAVKLAQANPKETYDELLAQISSSYNHFKGFAINVKFDNSGKVGERYCVDFELIRRVEDGSFVYNKNLGKRNYRKADDVCYPAFNPNEVDLAADLAENDGKQKGQLAYFFDKKPNCKIYPVPEFYSAIADIETDGQISQFDNEQVKNGFFPSAILTILGPLDDTIKDENGLTAKGRLQQTLKKFTSEGEGRGRLLLLTALNKDLIPDLKAFDIEKVLTGMTDFSDRISRKVTRAMGVPPVLVGFADTATLGNTQAIVNSIQLFNADINDGQRFISRCLKRIDPDPDFTISKLNILNYIPTEVFAKMTADEIRAIAGLQPLPKATNSGTEKTSNAINALSPLVSNKVLDSLSEEEIRNLVGLPTADDEKIKETLTADQTRTLVEIVKDVKANLIGPEMAIEILKISIGIGRARAAKVIGYVPPDPNALPPVVPPVSPAIPLTTSSNGHGTHK